MKRFITLGILLASSLLYAWHPHPPSSIPEACQPGITGIGHCAESPFCRGTKVVSRWGRHGIIETAFSDSRISVTTYGYSKPGKHSKINVAVKKGCTPDDFCVGDKFIDKRGREGYIEGIFCNGTLSVHITGYGKNARVGTSSIGLTEQVSDRPVLFF